jgi:hypothetical protein
MAIIGSDLVENVNDQGFISTDGLLSLAKRLPIQIWGMEE